MKIIVEYETEGITPLCKIVKVKVLPPLGSEMHFRDGVCISGKVTRIEWFKGMYVVRIKDDHLDPENYKVYKRHKDGWIREQATELIDFLKKVMK